jgi:hypothetical protein
MPQNPSHKYTFAMSFRNINGDILQNSIQPFIVIDGKKYEMQKHPDGNNIFIYDYQFYDIGPILYYFELSYTMNRHGNIREKIAKSELFRTEITNKYIFALDTNRGPVGAKVSIVGCGLGKNDKVYMDDRNLPTHWLSTGVIEFTIPPTECDREYEIYLVSNRKKLLAGTFFVDRSNLRCSSDFIHLDNGENQRLIFMLDHGAPAEGLLLEITTDIPKSIIMPEVHFTPGERTTSINIKGSDQSAKGMLFVNAKGFTTLEIPVEVGSPKIIDEDFPTENVYDQFQNASLISTNRYNDKDVIVL